MIFILFISLTWVGITGGMTVTVFGNSYKKMLMSHFDPISVVLDWCRYVIFALSLHFLTQIKSHQMFFASLPLYKNKFSKEIVDVLCQAIIYCNGQLFVLLCHEQSIKREKNTGSTEEMAA